MRNILFSVVLLGICSSADAAVLCAPKSGEGSVSVRTQCKKNEVPLNPVALGLQGTQGPKGDKGDTGSQGPAGPGAVVRDTNGAFVGTMWTESMVLQQGTTGIGVRIPADSGGFVEDSSFIMYHESSNCSGPGLFASSGATEMSLINRGYVRGSTVFYPVEPKVVATARSQSESPRTQAECGQIFILPNICCQTLGNVTTDYYPAEQLDMGQFVPPFHVEVQE